LTQRLESSVGAVKSQSNSYGMIRNAELGAKSRSEKGPFEKCPQGQSGAWPRRTKAWGGQKRHDFKEGENKNG